MNNTNKKNNIWETIIKKRTPNKIKSVVTIGVALIFVLTVIGLFRPTSLKSIIINTDSTKVYDVFENVELEYITTDVEELPLNAFKHDGGELSIASNNKLHFTSDESGVFKIWAKKGNVQSNFVLVKVENSKASEEKREKELIKIKEDAVEEYKQKEQKRIEAEEKRIEEEKKTRIAAEVQAPAPAKQQQEQPIVNMVWITATGSKYHSHNSCGRTNPNKARQMSRTDAEAEGYGPCRNCH